MLNDLSIFIADSKRADREHFECKHPYRDKYERDRDRILYCKPFRRTKGKTQVFTSGHDDHSRTRLTHTLEVSQIATSIARCLNLDVMLCEAVALGHDIGHSPFGHAGESELNRIMNGCETIYNYSNVLKDNNKGFKHNWQGVRNIVDLTTQYEEFSGLNLTYESIWGILNHTGVKPRECDEYDDEEFCRLRGSKKKCNNSHKLSYDFYIEKYKKYNNTKYWTVEATIVAHADEIAQIHHDIEDAYFEGIVDRSFIIEKLKIFKGYFNKADMELFNQTECSKVEYFPMFVSKLVVNFLVDRYINHLSSILNHIKETEKIKSNSDFYKYKERIYADYFSNLEPYENSNTYLYSNYTKFKKSMQEIILNSHLTQKMDGRSRFIIRQLFKAYLSNPRQLSDGTIERLYNKPNKAIELRKNIIQDCKKDNFKNKLFRTICDHIAGMTDEYALNQYRELYGVNFKVFNN